MARVLVVTSHPPFTRGGHLVLADQLVVALRGLGHDTDLVYTPQNRFGRQGAAYLATWLTDVGESDERRVDQVISLRFPAYAVRHPRHVCWLLHTMREVPTTCGRRPGRGCLPADASRKARAAFWCTRPTGFFSGPVAWPGCSRSRGR